MAKIKDRINNILDYFRGMEIKNGFYIVKVQYGNRWGAYNSKDELIKVAKSEEVQNEWFYYADTDNAELDDIFDLIEETINMNKSALAKVELLKNKIEELKVLFEENTLEVLNTLEFSFSAPKKTKRKKSTKKAKEEPTEVNNEEITLEEHSLSSEDKVVEANG